MQAVDEPVSRNIVVRPTDVPQEQKTAFQPTSTRGVSFPEEQRTPTVVVSFGRPAEVQSISIPRDRTPGANTQQFEVTFFAPDGSQINPTPIRSSISPQDDRARPALLNLSEIPSTTPVSRLEIKVIRTTDDRSPKGVILDIKACVEPTTGSYLSYLNKIVIVFFLYRYYRKNGQLNYHYKWSTDDYRNRHLYSYSDHNHNYCSIKHYLANQYDNKTV